MKKLSLWIAVCCMLLSVVTSAQPELLTHVTFDDGNLPAGWTTSGEPYAGIAPSDLDFLQESGKFFRMLPNVVSDTVYLLSPEFTVEAGRGVRLEFNHIPMLESSSGGQIFIVADGSTKVLNQPTPKDPPSCYDATYGGGYTGAFMEKFYKLCYYGSDLQKTSDYTAKSSSYWKHEVFYLTNRLNGATTFRVKFAIPNKRGVEVMGWMLDDIKLYMASSASAEVRIPQITSAVKYPNMKLYPLCGDAEFSFNIKDAGGLSTVADSIYLSYRTEGGVEGKINFQDMGSNLYTAVLPFVGVDSMVYWKVVVNDEAGNVTNYPFTGIYDSFVFVRPHVGTELIGGTPSTSAEALMFLTDESGARQQIIYSADELKAAGYASGKIAGFYINIISTPEGVSTLDNFKLYMGNAPVTYEPDAGSAYRNVVCVLNEPSFTVPQTGWAYVELDPDIEFLWDGESDIVISYCFDGSSKKGTTKVASLSTSGTHYETKTYKATSSSAMAPCSASFDADLVVKAKPQLRFNFVDICHFAYDAGINKDTVLSPGLASDCQGQISKTLLCTANVPTDLKVLLRNDGTEDLHEVKVAWMLDDDVTTKDSATWKGTMSGLDDNLLPVDTAVVFTATTKFLPAAGIHTLKIWTDATIPSQDIKDWNYLNDTAYFKLVVTDGQMSGDYAIGGTISGIYATKTFETLDDAFLMLENAGVKAPVTFKIKPHSEDLSYYSGQWKFPTCIKGISAQNTLTFESSDDKEKVVFTPQTESARYLFDISDLKYLVFRNIQFVPSIATSDIKDLDKEVEVIKFGSSEYITFDSCWFESTVTTDSLYKINRILNIGSANNITVNNCRFKYPAVEQINIKGLSPVNTSTNIRITNSEFYLTGFNIKHATASNISAQYTQNLLVESNQFISAMSTGVDSALQDVIYSVSLLDLYNSEVSKNVFKLQSSSAISMNEVTGTIIANNRIGIQYANKTSANFSCYGINMLSGQENKLVYNNIYTRSMVSVMKKSYGMSLGYGDLTVKDNIVKNNIIMHEGYGSTINLRPSETESNKSFALSNNMYYKVAEGGDKSLFTYKGSSTTSVYDWKINTLDTNSFYDQNPIFYAWDNLLTTNTVLCEAGEYIMDVTDDCFNESRPTSDSNKKPCIGAQEFDPPLNNVFVVLAGVLNGTFDGNQTFTGCDFGNDSVYVTFKNISTNTIEANKVKFNYSVDGYSSSAITFTSEIVPDSLYTLVFPITHDFSAVNESTTNFTLKVWSICDLDIVKYNDTASSYIVSLYQKPALAPKYAYLDYATSTNINVASQDSVYWYYSMSDSTYFYKGHSFESPVLYTDTVYYFSQKSEIPVLRLTELQISSNSSKEGVTEKLPSYVQKDNVYELSNFGNSDMDLTGFTLEYYKTSKTELSSANNTYTFPDNYILKANNSVLLIPDKSLKVNSSLALSIPTAITFNATTKCGFILKDKSGNIVDALTINGVTFASSVSVPSSKWTNTESASITLTVNTAGIIRNNVNANSASGWTLADADNKMTIGTYNADLTVAQDNGCYGFKTPYYLKLNEASIPHYDPGIYMAWLTDKDTNTSLCRLTNETVTMLVTNTGLQTLEDIPVKCEFIEDGEVVSTVEDVLAGPMNQWDTVEFTLSDGFDFTATQTERNILVKVYVDYDGDTKHGNDTILLSIISRLTPAVPDVEDTSVDYGTSALLTAESDNIIIWFDNDTTSTELSRGDYTTPPLYEQDTFYVSTLLQQEVSNIIGSNAKDVSSSGSKAYPSPFNVVNKHVKEQYLLKATDLLEYGYNAGNIKELAFNISSVTTAAYDDTLRLSDYSVKIAPVKQDELTSFVSKGMTNVYAIDTLKIASDFTGWYTLLLDEPYYWDGSSDVLLQVCFSTEEKSGSVITSNVETEYVSTLSYRHNTNEVCSWTGTPTASYSSIPYMSMSMDVFGCYSERKPVIVYVDNTPECDAALLDVLTDDATVMSDIDVPVYVLLKNFGTSDLTSATISWTVNGEQQTDYSWTGTLAGGETKKVQIGTYVFEAGIATITANVQSDCDNMVYNDTVSTELSACLGNNELVTEYLISSTDEQADYTTINEAINSLTSSGVCGPIVFNIAAGTYDEQLSLSSIDGTSSENTVTFRGEDGAEVTITNTSSDETTVLILDGTDNVHFENVKFKGNDSKAENVITLHAVDGIHFTNTTFDAKYTSKEKVAELVTMTGINNNVYFVADTFSNAASALNVALLSEDSISNTFVMDSCYFSGMTTSAVALNSYNNAHIGDNTFEIVAPDNEFTALSVTNIGGQFSLERNRVHVTDATKDVYGVVLSGIHMTDVNPLYIVNNEIAIITQKIGTGLIVDESDNVYVYYNSILLTSKSKQTKSKCINIGPENSAVMVRNNIFENRAGGFAYYVDDVNDASIVSLSNNNNYYTTGATIAYWGNTNCATLQDLQTLNEMDASSVNIPAPFVNETYLRLLYPNDVVRAAEPLEDVSSDIVGQMRSVTPKPTMGAYEYIFSDVDAGIVEILDPVVSVPYIENDPLPVEVILKNFGNYGFSTIKIVAELRGHKYDEEILDKVEEDITMYMASLDTIHYTITQTLTPPLNTPMSDSLCLAVYTILDDDTVNVNDTVYMNIKVIAAKDIVMKGVDQQASGLARCGRNMRNQAITVKVANDGNKALTTADKLVLTYEVYNEKKDQLFTTATETLTFPYTYLTSSGVSVTVNTLAAHSNAVPYTFSTTCDLYPTGYNDTTWYIRAFVRLESDNNYSNDTSTYQAYQSRISPNPPEVTNDTINYSTWGHPIAGHIDKLPIKWFASEYDATAFYSPASYDASTMYTTDTLFNDTSFFVRVESKTGIACPSDFKEVKVIIKSRCPVDLSPLHVLSTPYIFMQEDTVKVTIMNRGTTPQTNFNVTYSIKPTGSAGTPVTVTETCTATVLPDQLYEYAFDSLFNFTSSVQWDAYAWVDAEGDCTSLNDTTALYKLTHLSDDVVAPTIKNPVSIDITRVQLANLDNSSLAFEDTYTDFTSTVEPAVLFRGMTDSLIVLTELANTQEKPEKTILTGWLKAWIDWNRDGFFDDNEEVYNDTVIPGEYNRGTITIPDSANTGHTRMRLILSQNDAEHTYGPYPGKTTSPLGGGEVEDYKVLIRPTEPVNADLMRIVTPERTTNETHQDIVVRLRNAGSQPLTKANITWFYNKSDTMVYEWTGSLQKSAMEDVTLATLDLPFGYNYFKMWVDVDGDSYAANDTLEQETNIYHTYVFNYFTDFDDENMSNNDFYAYEISLSQPSNCWEFGVPNDTINQYITSAYSKPYCWKTKRSGHYPRNNTSLLYSPVFDISDIKPDSLSFMIRKAMGKDAYMFVEYLNYAGSWVKLGTKDTMWYDTPNGFAGTNSGWVRAVYSLDRVAGDFGKVLQIRFVFKSGDAATAEGVGIDNFQIKRTLRNEDVGVDRIELTPERLPNYGQYFYPKVDIINYGKEKVDEFDVCYMSEDMYIPQCEKITKANLKPQDTLVYTFKHGRYLDASMPDPFTLMAYTRLTPGDLYRDNDTAYLTCVIGPLMNDASITSVVAPTKKAAASNDVTVKVKIHNYGLKAIESLPVGFSSDDGTYVNETVTFNPALSNGDDYVYTFQNTYNVPFGISMLKIWTGLENDDYTDNDTVYYQVDGLANSVDLEADYITLDATAANNYGVQLAFTNHSSNAIKNITVGYLYDGDTNTIVEEMYRGGGALEGGQTGYHMFTKRLPKGKEYQSVCAYAVVKSEGSGIAVSGDINHDNDTTCNAYIGYHDAVIDSIMIEETAEPTALVQIRAHNGGTLGGNYSVMGKYVINGDWDNPNQQKFEWQYSEPRPDKIQYMTFSRRIPKSADHKYDIVAWIEFPNDINHSNDTTDYYNTYTYVSLDGTKDNTPQFSLEQNKPNPFKDLTKIGFTIPQPGQIRFYVTNTAGQVVYTLEDNYPEGQNYIDFDGRNLEQGTYYYVLEYNGSKKSKKMIIIE